VRFPDECDLYTVPRVETEIRHLCDGRPRVILDFTETRYIDSTGLRMILSLNKEWPARLHLVVPERGTLSRILDVTGMMRILSVYRSIDEATAPAA
jgi:stage II sporulation protein AA (anti-sigma F factor antagonist)